MNKYTEDILKSIKKQFEATVGTKQFKSQNDKEKHFFYTEKLDDNLYLPMSVSAKASYMQGSGNELCKEREGDGKMNAIHSSSAMTYNLFWDEIGEIVNCGECNRFGKGIYQVELEKQYRTLNRKASKQPANLDAFLYCKHTNEAIACEMKMTEWILGAPGRLRRAYLDKNNYMDTTAGKVFADVAYNMIDKSKSVTDEGYKSIFSYYDAFQMFRHASACYNACMFDEPRKIKKLTLVNCVWTLPDLSKLSDKDKKTYLEREEGQKSDFVKFRKLMKPIMNLFADKRVDFDIKFITYSDFLGVFKKTQQELDYLKRYTFE